MSKIILISCECCGAYHSSTFHGDCRDDNNRYPTDNPKDKNTVNRVTPPKNIWQPDDFGVHVVQGVKIFEKSS